MGRKNRRSSFEPLDYTGIRIPLQVPASRPRGRVETQAEYDARWDERRGREERQRNARIAGGLDWSICMVVGCGQSLTHGHGVEVPASERNPSSALPICSAHAAIIWRQLARYESRRMEFADAIADLDELVSARQARQHEELKAANKANLNGDIYFVRINDLVKVGWTRDLRQRLRAYGASVELLAYYPATRDDETNLHRQLRPALAKGREWYMDGPIVQKFIDEALEKYGLQPVDPGWTQPKVVVAGKRRR